MNGEIEVEGAPKESTEETPADEKASAVPTTENGVPNFWVTAMKNNEVLVEEVWLVIIFSVPFFRINAFDGSCLVRSTSFDMINIS